ncbi:DUF5675 family protein [Croceibacter atlanticus]|jgi:hypothetical protein|uniref:DUF5675 domain-containing protein n=1 Tax=Croceibacter atlanticus (strain ATCC BAA-628 / JCM 21780 / CIP 108009 / IAM 15332 / KCTC 12090 / HTCC2559) TaxID=216432 RepID=A3UA46_CROAH|nr:DUF5675 family protein [Croceibacter atlanticus]EAP86682.1 hypothetical protein CA2559_11618 [Croceibacter atlanticus HTCC2559]
MELVLKRSYFEKGTNGALFVNGQFLCFTIELPWRENQRNISCIPEGTYEIVARHSKRFQNHLHVQDVKGRSLILIHPANNALKELRGCIAPVSQLADIGEGWNSRESLNKLLILCYRAIELNETITLTIKS